MVEKLIDSPATLLSLAGILCGTLFLLTWVTWHYWHYSRRHAADLQLKRDMLARGLSAEDIERVMWVSSDNTPASAMPQAPETLSPNEYALIERMMDDERGTDDIERLVRALRSGNTPRPPERHVKPADVPLERVG